MQQPLGKNLIALATKAGLQAARDAEAQGNAEKLATLLNSLSEAKARMTGQLEDSQDRWRSEDTGDLQ